MKLLLLLILPINIFASEKFINTMCQKWRVSDCNAVKAIAWVESNFRHVINENDGGSPSFGIMQIKCIAAKEAGLKYSCDQLHNKQIALRFGIKFLEQKIKKYGSLQDAFAAYNANRPIICKNYNAGKCYPNEYINHEYVYKVMRRYKYEIYKNTKLSMNKVEKNLVN